MGVRFLMSRTILCMRLRALLSPWPLALPWSAFTFYNLMHPCPASCPASAMTDHDTGNKLLSSRRDLTDCQVT